MLNTSNTKKVIDMLRRHSDDREIIFEDINKHPKYTTYLGVTRQTQEKICVYINYSFSENIQEATFIHEILHIILCFEGYPDVIINNFKMKQIKPKFHDKLYYIRDQLSSVIHHPIIYKRIINLFNLDIDEYFKTQVEQKIIRFDLRKSKSYDIIDKIFLAQQDMILSVDFFSYPEKYRDQILTIFKERHPDTYRSSLALNKKLKFESPKDCYNSAKEIKKHIMKYGKRKGVYKVNVLWDALDIIK